MAIQDTNKIGWTKYREAAYPPPMFGHEIQVKRGNMIFKVKTGDTFPLKSLTYEYASSLVRSELSIEDNLSRFDPSGFDDPGPQ